MALQSSSACHGVLRSLPLSLRSYLRDHGLLEDGVLARMQAQRRTTLADLLDAALPNGDPQDKAMFEDMLLQLVELSELQGHTKRTKIA